MSLGNSSVFEIRDNAYLKPWKNCTPFGSHDPSFEHQARRSASEPNLAQPLFKDWMKLWTSPDRNRPRYVHQADPLEPPPLWGSPVRGPGLSPPPWATELPGGSSPNAGTDHAAKLFVAAQSPARQTSGPSTKDLQQVHRGLRSAMGSEFPPVYPQNSNWKRSTYMPVRNPGYVGTLYTR